MFDLPADCFSAACWVIADLVGKGIHIRTIPVPDWVKASVDNWAAAAGITTAGGELEQIQFLLRARFCENNGTIFGM